MIDFNAVEQAKENEVRARLRQGSRKTFNCLMIPLIDHNLQSSLDSPPFSYDRLECREGENEDRNRTGGLLSSGIGYVWGESVAG